MLENLLFDSVFSCRRTDELEVSGRLLGQTVDEKIKVVDVIGAQAFQLVNELFDVGLELGLIYVDDQIQVNFVLLAHFKGDVILLLLNQLLSSIKHGNSGAEPFEIPSWHLNIGSGSIAHHDLGSSFHVSHMEGLITGLGEMRQFCSLGNGELLIQVVCEQVVEHVWASLDEVNVLLLGE